MSWIGCGALSAAVLAAAAAVALTMSKRRGRRVFKPFNVIYLGVFVSAFICLLPIYSGITENNAPHALETALFSLHHTLQIFTLDADRAVILENVHCDQPWLTTAYTGYLSILFILGPILTGGLLIGLFKNVSAYLQYALRYFADVSIFSELNEKSLTLAADLRRGHPRQMIVFTGVRGGEEDIDDTLLEQARDLRAVCFKKEITAVSFKLHQRKAQMLFFLIGGDESQNVAQALDVAANYRDRENTRMYVFSTGIESELLLSKAGEGKLKLHRVNDVRALINRSLYENGWQLFEHAKPMPDGQKKISAVLVGLGQHGAEMLKALAWYCQMDGYHVEIDAFDRDKHAADRIAAQCPELLSDRYNGVLIPGEAEYTIRVHGDMDTGTKTFADAVAKLTDTTYVLVALGDDEANIRTAVDMRMYFERLHIKPVIQAIVYSPEKRAALAGITNYRGQAYDIEFIGDLESSYTEAVILNSELEQEALRGHLKWGKEEDFWRYEYNYRSSMASAIHLRARIKCGIPGAGKSEDDLTQAERDIIEPIEHRRWNAYMRSEGYIYSGSPEKSSRNDLAKMHHDLVDFSSLSEEEKRKDSRVGTR